MHELDVLSYLEQKLKERLDEDRYRSLPIPGELTDFCSNDYLGFARSPEIREKLVRELERHPGHPLGATGSRLISGNSVYIEHLEDEIALFHHAEAGLIFNSGYSANLGLFSSVPKRGDVVICDELIHASIIDGVRLGWGTRHTFLHNDLDSLEEKLQGTAGRHADATVFVVVESLYSMDGDQAPLEELVQLTEKYNARLIVDEAHAGGVYGKNGRGLVPQLGLEERVFARIYTFGKALGSHGAIIVGSRTLKNYLVNFARPLIYTTALPFHNLAGIKCAYEMLTGSPGLQQALRKKIAFYGKLMAAGENATAGSGPIQTVHVPGNREVKAIAVNLRRQGFDVRAILSPTVPPGKERLRICLHLFNTEEDIGALVASLRRLS